MNSEPARLPGGLAVVIPARDQAGCIGATVEAARRITAGGVAVSLVVVVDDGSSDDTARLAEEAGATVIVHPSGRGRAAALSSGAVRVASLDRSADLPAPRALLFLDADLQGSAVAAAALAERVLAGELDMAIALTPSSATPSSATPGEGRGRVVRLARSGIEREPGWAPEQPLSGNRCLTREAFDAGKPLAAGWGVEVGLTIDLLAAGKRVGEVPCALQHPGSGASAADAGSDRYRDVWLALLDRRVRKRESRLVLVAVVGSRIARSLLGRGKS